MVTVSSEPQTKPSVPVIVSQCGPSTDGLLTFGCVTSGFFPSESLNIQWTLGSGNKSSEMQFPAMKSQNNKFMAVSQVRVSAADWSNLTCAVNHPAGSETTTVKGNSPPVLHVGEVGQSIMCLIEDFYPKELNITWKKDNQEVTGTDWKAIGNAPGSYKAVSLLQANKTSKDTKYTCEVTHANVKYERQLSSKAKFSLTLNPPSTKDLFVRKKAVITCVVTGENKKEVETANVLWTVGGQNRASAVTDSVKGTTPPFTKTSTLTLEESEWFSGKEVKCSTERDKTTFSDKINVKKGGKRPSILFYKPEKSVSDTETVSLLCEVSSSDLGNVYVMWQMNGGEYREGNSTVHINANTVLSYLTVSGKDYKNNVFTCAVKDSNTENDTIPKTNATSIKENQDPGLYMDCVKLVSHEDDYNSLWSTASSFIFLFLFSIVYSTVLSLTKMK